ncbi:MAG: hypothetical protein WAQ25_01610, partial [Candidatus Saccharimonas sp.]
TERFFGRAGITMPTTQEFVDAGINFEDIATVYAQEKDAGHEPQMVVAANGLSLETWRQLCRDIGKASAKESASSERPKLLIYAKYGIITNWSILTDLSHLPGAGANSRVMTHQGIPWTIRIIPGTPAPTVTEVDHAYKEAQHPTISDYLTLQAIRCELGEAAVDPVVDPALETAFPYSTWLAGDFVNGTQAPYGSISRDDHRIDLEWRFCDFKFYSFGARPAV